MSNPNCCNCGRFCSWDADYSIPFGGPLDLEPPDPEYYCDRCVDELKEEAISIGHVYSNWIPANWELEAAKELGLVRAGPKGAAWSQFKYPDKLPGGWVIREESEFVQA